MGGKDDDPGHLPPSAAATTDDVSSRNKDRQSRRHGGSRGGGSGGSGSRSKSSSRSNSRSGRNSRGDDDSHNLSTTSKRDNIKVYVRLRPMNKQEKAKRSKDCIEFHDGNASSGLGSGAGAGGGNGGTGGGRITVESPLQGSFDFQFDGVFDEFASNEEVYRGCSASNIPQRLVSGTDCTFFAYGQSKTGKSHTIFGEGRGVELEILAKEGDGPDDNRNGSNNPYRMNDSLMSFDSRISLDPSKNPHLTMGVLPWLVTKLFDLLYATTDQGSDYEFTIRCSFVEIFLDKMTDLVQPGHEEGRGLRVGIDGDGQSCVLGATELCCLSPQDVFALITRGMANRTKDGTGGFSDSVRSHAVFTLRLEQVDRVSGRHCQSRLHIVDLAGSEEVDPTTNDKVSPSADAIEGRMLNSSLARLNGMVNDILHQQQQGDAESKPKSDSSLTSLNGDSDKRGPYPKIAKLLKPSIGGNTFTVMLCTGSSSYHNIDETIRTLRFGQQIRKVTNAHYDSAPVGFTIQAYKSQLLRAKQHEGQLLQLIRLMAQESKHGKSKKKDPKNPQVWDAILRIADVDKELSRSKKYKKEDHKTTAENSLQGLHISISGESEQNKELERLRARVDELECSVQKERTAREKSESLLSDMRTQLAAVKGQNAELLKKNQKLSDEVTEAKSEVKAAHAQKTETEHKLRTSLFRENEAILFMRQFRTFYFRLLKNKAAHGNGSINDVIQGAKGKIPGIADLNDLLDIDKLMVQSGIIEADEVGNDTFVADYAPSEDALTKSSAEAEDAEKREVELLKDQTDMNNTAEGNGMSTAPDALTLGQLVAYRQRLLETPAGRLALEKEKELEQDLMELSKKCISLQNAVNAEKTMVEALSSRAGAMTKLKQAQEINLLKQELERRTNDLHAIVWKMNELHLANKQIDTKVVTREQQLTYFEDHVYKLNVSAAEADFEQQEYEKRLAAENDALRTQIERLRMELWQLGEASPPMWRLSVPANGAFIDLGEGDVAETGASSDENIDRLADMVEEKVRVSANSN